MRQVYSDDRECDPNLYRQFYPDLSHLSETRHSFIMKRTQGGSTGFATRVANV